jgi:hypothetical protein
MAAKKKSSKNKNSTKPIPDPFCESYYMHGQVGGTATWECATPNYPKFQLIFKASNPFNGAQNAEFSGNSKRPLSLAFKNAGTFEYLIRHIMRDGSNMLVGPYCVNVVPPTLFQIPPRKCPPECSAV